MANTKAKKSEEVLPAMLKEDEPLITKEMAQKYTDFVEDLENKENRQKMIKTEQKASGGKKAASMHSAGDNAIGSASAERPKKPSAKAGPKKATVAIYSDRNVSWVGVGKITKGYNIVTPEQAEQWLTRNHVREATPEEVASEFGA
jgi:DNA-binding protein H-NS